MADPQRLLRALFQLTRLLKAEELAPEARVESLFDHVFPGYAHEPPALAPGKLADWAEWEDAVLVQALGLSEQLIALYVIEFHDPRVIPVTHYKRERKVRRQLDALFSSLIKELARRTGGPSEPALISEEPIYYLMQKFRERKFPKPKSSFATLEILKARLHSDLVQCFGRDPFSDSPRRVLLPHEIR